MSENDSPSITLTRTIYDPSTKDFITSTPDAKALPHIKEWINQHNPVIYWYILRIDNPSDASIDQWAVELYTHQALSITEVYVDGIDRRFEVRKRERDPWSEKYVLSIPRQVGIPIIGKGTRRIFFKVDIDCKEGLMHEYGISGAFMAQGMDPIEIKEKMFQYSCKVGEFKQIFDKDPHEASHYAEKRLVGKYSSNSVQVFTNSFRMIHELYGYCHSGSLNRDDLLQKLHLLHASFEKVPEIAGEHITPLIHDGICELDVIVDRDKFAPRFIKLCDALVELLHIEVMGAEVKDVYTPPPEPVQIGGAVNGFNTGGQKECPACGNVIDSSNKVLICMECGSRFCNTCEGWYREEERTRGQKPLCKDCFTAEQKWMREAAEREVQLERERKEKEEQEKQHKEIAEKIAREEAERKKKEEEERLRREQKQKEKELRAKGEQEAKKKQEEENERLEKERVERELKKEEERLRRQKGEEAEKARKEKERKAEEEKIIDSYNRKIQKITTKLHEKIHEHKELIKAFYMGEKISENDLEIVKEFVILKNLESASYIDMLSAQMSFSHFGDNHSKSMASLTEINRKIKFLEINSQKSFELTKKANDIKSKRIKLGKEKNGNYINRIFLTKRMDETISERIKELDILLIEQEKRIELYLKTLDSTDILP